MRVKFFIFLLTLLSVGMTACSPDGKKGSGGGAYNDKELTGERDSLRYARNLTLDRIGEGENIIYVATVRNPWDTVKRMERYLLVPKGMDLPGDLPEGKVVRVPVNNALIYSSLHSGLVGDLGAGKAIGGVCNARYITDKELSGRIARGEVTDCGEGMNPDMEKIIQLHPEVIMLSPFENNDRYAKVAQLGIPVIECADYMETSPLGQAEWMKFYGLLFGKGDEAGDRFDGIEKRYNDLKAQAARSEFKPKVLMDEVYSGSWSVPGGESTMGRLIEDAGGVNPFSGYRKSGGVSLAPEKVLMEAGDADVWLVRYNQKSEKTLPELSRDAPVNSQFKAFKRGEVYGCNTQYIPFFDETPFHPDLLLEDLSRIFRSVGSEEPENTRYFRKMK